MSREFWESDRIADRTNGRPLPEKVVRLSKAGDRDPVPAGFRDQAEGQADVCRCPACTSPFVAASPRRHRGSVQDESGALDPMDARAMREIEGRAP